MPFLKKFLYLFPGFFSQLAVFPVPHCCQVVNCCIFKHRQEDKDETDPEVNVHSFDIGDPGHGGIDSSDDGGHGEHRGYTCSKENIQLCFSIASTALARKTAGTYLEG